MGLAADERGELIFLSAATYPTSVSRLYSSSSAAVGCWQIQIQLRVLKVATRVSCIAIVMLLDHDLRCTVTTESGNFVQTAVRAAEFDKLRWTENPTSLPSFCWLPQGALNRTLVV